ncbi:MAG: polysaccharide biosynthesis C-terminal domain-containing protein [Candidatus Bathyarchaeia archaeon]
MLSFLYAGVGSIVLPSLFNGVGGTDINLKATLVYYGVFIPSAVALTLVFKVEGLLISILISTGVSVLYSLKAAAKRYGISPDLKIPARIYASSTISMAPLIPLVLYLQLPYQVNFVVGAILYTLTYLTVAPIFKAINEEDIQNLTRIFMKIKPLKPMVKVLANYERRILKLWV